MTDTLLLSREVCELLGITYRQLEHNTRIGEFPCTHNVRGSGKLRRYTLADVLAIQRVLAHREIATTIWPGVAVVARNR